MKFYVLSSNSIRGLERNIFIIPKEDLIVVINTTDRSYRWKLIALCEDAGVEHYVTESDGTPATGKNSVIKLFLESDNEHMVMIDGDDFLTYHGIDLYKNLAKHPDVPDMVVLYRQPQMSGHCDTRLMLTLAKNLEDVDFETQVRIGLCYPADKSDARYLAHCYGLYMHHFWINSGIEFWKAHEWAQNRHAFNMCMEAHSESSEYMCRMVFYSRNIAKATHFDNSIVVGEDTLQFMQHKNRALKGEFKILRRHERNLPTYIGCSNPNSITVEHGSKDGINWEWVATLLDRLDTIDLPEPFKLLPEFKDESYT